MFRCQMCNRIVPPSTRATKLVVATRERIYEPRGQDPRERRGGRSFRGRRGPRKKKPYDKGGQGVEIVRELAVCPSCAAEYADTPPEHHKVTPTLDVGAALEQAEQESESRETQTAGAES